MGDDRNFQILLVEDNPDDAELTIRALRDVVPVDRLLHVDDGAKALELLFGSGGLAERDRFHPRVVLLDLKVPKVNGLELLRRLKSDERTRCIPVVVLTSSMEERDIAGAYELGVNSYIVKPVAFDQYLSVVSRTGLYWRDLNRVRAVT